MSRVPRFFVLFGCAFLLIWFALWLPKSKFALNYARSNPVQASNWGSVAMQQAAAEQLTKSIQPGTSAKELTELIGPNSPGWPDRFEPIIKNEFRGESMIGFNVRASRNCGLLLHFNDGKIVTLSTYD